MSTTIILTGASDRIGAEMARQLARQLARKHGKRVNLVLAARNAETLTQVAQQCDALAALKDEVKPK